MDEQLRACAPVRQCARQSRVSRARKSRARKRLAQWRTGAQSRARKRIQTRESVRPLHTARFLPCQRRSRGPRPRDTRSRFGCRLFCNAREGASDHPRAADARAAAVQHVFAGDRRDRGRSACGDALKAAALSRTTLSTADVHASTAAASIAISRLPIAHWPCSIHDPCFPKAPPLRLARRATMAGDEMKE